MRCYCCSCWRLGARLRVPAHDHQRVATAGWQEEGGPRQTARCAQAAHPSQTPQPAALHPTHVGSRGRSPFQLPHAFPFSVLASHEEIYCFIYFLQYYQVQILVFVFCWHNNLEMCCCREPRLPASISRSSAPAAGRTPHSSFASCWTSPSFPRDTEGTEPQLK